MTTTPTTPWALIPGTKVKVFTSLGTITRRCYSAPMGRWVVMVRWNGGRSTIHPAATFAKVATILPTD